MSTTTLSTGRIPSLAALLETDFDHLLDQLATDLPRIAGKRLLITGGAGFLGYYLVQTALAWNRRASRGDTPVTSRGSSTFSTAEITGSRL